MGNLLIGMVDFECLIMRKVRSRKPPALDRRGPGREALDMARAFSLLTNPAAGGWQWRAHSFGAARWRGW